MLEIVIPGRQCWDAKDEEFRYEKDTVVRMEHSLVSLSKWECKWHVPFFSNIDKLTPEQAEDYYRCMTVTQGVDPSVYSRMTAENRNAIQIYLNDPMTATWFHGEPRPDEPQTGTRKHKRPNPPKRGRSVMTAEVIYAQMFGLGIPLECERWHLNRLFTLIRVCQESNTPPKKMSAGERMAQQKMLNEQRRAKFGTRG